MKFNNKLYTMNKQLLQETDEWVKKYMDNYDCSHNYKHVIRVKNLALKIADSEKLDEYSKFIIILGALTHDIADHKYNSENTQEELLKEFFKDKLSNDELNEVIFIASNTSLSKENSNSLNGNINNIDYSNTKLRCVQDADRLDSLGSIGIARYFIYGVINKKSDMECIVNNLEDRTDILLKYIKTNYAKELANEKYKIIKMFIDDFRLQY